jgi:hypothetical protein
MTPLILKLTAAMRRLWRWRDDHYDVVENGLMVGRIFHLDAAAPEGRPWMWGSGHNGEYAGAPAGTQSSARPSLLDDEGVVAQRDLAPGCGRDQKSPA